MTLRTCPKGRMACSTRARRGHSRMPRATSRARQLRSRHSRSHTQTDSSDVGFDLVVGAAHSAASMPLTILADDEKLPPMLEGRNAPWTRPCPYFHLLNPSDFVSVYAAAMSFNSIDYEKNGSLYINDGYGKGCSTVFMIRAVGHSSTTARPWQRQWRVW